MNRLIQLERELGHREHEHRELEARVRGAATRRRRVPVRAGMSRAKRLSEALYGTGEHVLAGEDLPKLAEFEVIIEPYFTQVRYPVGMSGPGGKPVECSYGELIAMADLFEDFDQMDSAAYAELNRLRDLVRKSRKHYAHSVFGGSPARNITDEQYQQATEKRYLRLALDNFAHFAPSDPAISKPYGGEPANHRSAWESHHRRAFELVQSLRTDQGIIDALAINAFGDHYLTDAFAAGHLFNKWDVNRRFKAQILDGTGSITERGERFFGKVAAKAFTGKLKAAFSRHETGDRYVLTIGGWQFDWFGFHPKIDSVGRFKEFLLGIQKERPDAMGKVLIAKLIHDRLNDWPGGLLVENDSGERWNLTGDGTLNVRNLGMIRRAVSRSIYNVAVEAPQDVRPEAMFDTVWGQVPKPTPKSTKKIAALIGDFTDPASGRLIDGAAALVRENYPVLLDEAKATGALQRA